MKIFAYLLSAILTLSLAWIWFFWEPHKDQSEAHQILSLSSPPSGGDFTLNSWRGPVSLRDFRGKLVLLYFGYTLCPDVCPTNLGYISMGLERLPEAERQRVQVLFVSVDPERDSLEHLRQYSAFFHQQVLGISGSAEEIQRVAKLYGAAYRKVDVSASAAGYLVDHSAYTYVIGPDGALKEQLDHATPPDSIAQTLRKYLSDN